jgi:membrane protease YdiL (CAAX protease family)
VKSIIRNLPASAEFCLVALICFGLPIASSIWVIAGRFLSAEPPHVQGGNGALLFVATHQLLALAVVLWIGRIRGWSPTTFGLRFSWKLTGVGILLSLCIALTIAFVAPLVSFLNPGGWQVPARLEVALPSIILISLINPFFEEVMQLGYLVHSLERFGIWTGLCASVLLRGFLHSYGGANAMILNLAIALIMALAYLRWRQLWPPIVAHAMINFITLLPHAQAS